MRQAEEALKYGIDELSRRALLEECNRYCNALMEIAESVDGEHRLGRMEMARVANNALYPSRD